jgi:hypothetical protein
MSPRPKTKKESHPYGWNSLYHQKYPDSCTARQVFWLSDQPEEVSLPTEGLYKPPAVAAFALTSSVPDYSGGTAPDLHRVPDCLGFGLQIL